MTRRRPLWGRRQWTRLALAVIGLGMFLGCSWVVLAPQLWSPSNAVAPHGIGQWIWNRMRPTRPATGSPGIYTYAIRIGGISWTILAKRLIAQAPDGSLHDIGARDSSADYLPNWVAPDGWTGYYITGSCTMSPDGVWAGSRTRLEIATAIQPIQRASGPYPPLNHTDILQLFWDAVDQQGRLPVRRAKPSLVATGMWTGSKANWSGYALNALTVLGLGTFLWFTLRFLWDWWRAHRIRARAGKCLVCAYDLGGLPEATSVCPECGSARGRSLSDA